MEQRFDLEVSADRPVLRLDYLFPGCTALIDEAENGAKEIEWDAKRFLSKNNYLIQTDAVKNYLIPSGNYKENLEWLAYAEEADILNAALFGFTAKAWRDENPELAKKNNVRDFASINELTVLSNLKTHNAQMIREGRNKVERFHMDASPGSEKNRKGEIQTSNKRNGQVLAGDVK